MSESNIVDMNHILNNFDNFDNFDNHNITSNVEKHTFIDNHIMNIFLPYIIYMKIILSNDKIYKKIKRNQKNLNTSELNIINLYFLMEIIKKKIEVLDI